jgi:hypothetical protein
MRIPMRDKQPNRPKSLRLKISFFVLQLILGNKNRVIRRIILASLYNLGYRYRHEQGVFSPAVRHVLSGEFLYHDKIRQQ